MLAVCNVVDVRARSSISHSHCSRLSPSCDLVIILFCFYFAFSHAVAIAVSPLLFSLLGLPCHSSLISAIFIAMPFSPLPSILSLFSQQLSQLFIQGWTFELPFLLWSCRRHSHFAAKDVFVVTTGRRPIFFSFSGCRSRHFHAMLFLLSLLNR